MTPSNAVLIVDNSDHRRAGAWFEACLGGEAEVQITARDDVEGLGKWWRAVILTGSEHSIFEDADWIIEELVFVRHLVDEGAPVLCVCFGYHLLFRALYGKDILARRALPEVGWPSVKLGGHPLFEGEGKAIHPYNFHFDEIVEIPPGWEAVASSDACRLHGLSHRELPVVGLQFHPEVTPAEGAAGILRGAQSLAAYGLDAASIAAAGKGGRHYPGIIRRFVSTYGK